MGTCRDIKAAIGVLFNAHCLDAKRIYWPQNYEVMTWRKYAKFPFIQVVVYLVVSLIEFDFF